MRIGAPVVLSSSEAGRAVEPLSLISTRRDDSSAFPEDLLQELIEHCPNVLPVREFLPSVSAVFSLGREVPVDIGGNAGYIDNFLVADDGHLVVVETKLYRNPEATRDVVTQTLQYGMAISGMRVQELEAAIRRGQKPALRSDEGIVDCVSRLSAAPAGSAQLAGDWEEALERNLRRGEILLLVVSDEIRVGVERVTHWLNEQGSSAPFKFGLVELRFYGLGERLLVVPRTLIKTREISRHVVVVDIQPTADVSVAARVIDEFDGVTGGKQQESRQVKAASVPRTKGTILELLSPETRPAATRVIEALETLGFEAQGTPATLKMGFRSDDEEFHSLVTLDWAGVWAWLLKRDRDRLGDEEVLGFKRAINGFGRFFPADRLDKPDVNGGCAVKFTHLEASAAEFAAFLDTYRTKILDAMRVE